MKKTILIAVSIFAIVLSFVGCATVFTSSNAQKLETALLTVANVVQTANTGFLKDAPTVETILTLTHNAGDAQVLANVANQDATLTPAIQLLQAQISAAVKASIAAGSTPAQQQAAVSAAVSPASVSSIVATVTAAGS